MALTDDERQKREAFEKVRRDMEDTLQLMKDANSEPEACEKSGFCVLTIDRADKGNITVSGYMDGDEATRHLAVAMLEAAGALFSNIGLSLAAHVVPDAKPDQEDENTVH